MSRVSLWADVRALVGAMKGEVVATEWVCAYLASRRGEAVSDRRVGQYLSVLAKNVGYRKYLL